MSTIKLGIEQVFKLVWAWVMLPQRVASIDTHVTVINGELNQVLERLRMIEIGLARVEGRTERK